MKARPLQQRFWSKVEKTEDCWLWTDRNLNKGYGRIPEKGKGSRLLSAHRLAWELYYGPIPDGMFVLHTCDVRRCVCPRHLWLGTHADNMADCLSKGRKAHLHGERNGWAKLTREDVLDIRASTDSRSKIALKYGIHFMHVSRLRGGRRWAHLE